MNLLIEQRPTTITSSKSHQQSQISNENDMNNTSSSSPSSPLVLKIKRHTTKQAQEHHNAHSPSSHMSEDDSSSRSTSNIQRLKRTSLLNTTATRRPSSPAFNGKQQTTKRSVTIDNNNNDLTATIDEISSTKRFKRDDLNQSSSNKVDACVETVSIGLATEPDHLGPCEPGTSVVLEGIVWNETDSGVLVVNVTWRGKTYVGTLLDSTKQDWACPRLTCESPTSDYDPRNGNKANRTKRTGGNNRCINPPTISLCQQITSTALTSRLDDRKLRNNIKSRQSKRLNNLPSTINEETSNQPSPLTSPFRMTSNQTFFASETTTTTTTTVTTSTNSSSNLEPQLIPCSEPQCHKRFASNLALSYHVSNAHIKSESTPAIPQANTRDEEDVAHILANVADYVRRSPPPPPVAPSSSIHCSPDHQPKIIPSAAIVNSPPSNSKTLDNCSSSTLSWPCPQISSNLVLSSPLNHIGQTLSPNSNRCKLNNNETNHIDQDEWKASVKSADHFLLHIQDVPTVNKKSSTSSSSSSSSSSTNEFKSSTKKDRQTKKKRSKTPTPPPPPTSSSPAYSDISDEDPTPNEQTFPPSTVNLLTATNGKFDENGNNLHSSSPSFLSNNGEVNNADLANPSWPAQMLFQQFGPFLQQTAALSTTSIPPTKDLSTTPNRLNSNNNTCPSANGTSDSTVKNILDARRSLTSKSSTSSPPPQPPTNLFHYHSNETRFPTPIINTLTSPNENLLHLSSTAIKPIDILDYSLNNGRTTNGGGSGGQYHHSSSLHPSR